MRRILSLGLWLALAATASAEVGAASPPEDFSEASLAGGVSMGVGMLRLGGDDEAPIPLEGNVVARAAEATRLIVDEATGATFGYRIAAAPLGSYSSARAIVRVDILPLDANAERDLRRLRVCDGCPALSLAASSVRYPPQQIVRVGETIVIDLLERAQTGEKIVDVVKFSSEPVTREELAEVRKRLRLASRHVRRGDELAANGSLAAAAAQYAQALALQPDAAVHRRLGQCQQSRGRTDEALREYEKAVRLDAGDADARLLLSVLRHRRGEFGRAADGYRHALRIRPGWALARLNLATAQLDRGDVVQALAEYRQAHRADPAILETKDTSSVRARDAGLQAYVIAKVYATEGGAAAALAWLEKAVAAGFGDLERARTDPDFASLRQDPRFVGLVSRTNRS
jgi:tetratricopeptide (TPR) repeat protein